MKSIKSKIIINFFVVFLGICIFFSFMTTSTLNNTLLTEVEDSLQSLAIEGSRVVSSKMEVDYVFLEGIAARDDIRDPQTSIDDKMSILKREVERSRGYLRIGIADKEGRLYLSDTYGDGRKIIDINSNEYFTDSIGGKRGLMSPTVSDNPDDKEALIIINSVPLYHNGEIVGILVAVYEADYLMDIISAMKLDNSAYPYIIDSKGTTLVHPDRNMTITQFNPIEEAKKDESIKPLAELYNGMIEGENGVINYVFQDNKKLCGYSTIDGTNWTLVIDANESEELSIVSTIQMHIIYTSILVLIICLIICNSLGKSIATPIINLAKQAEKLTNYDVTIDEKQNMTKYLKRKDEIGTLTKALVTIQNMLVEPVKNNTYNTEKAKDTE